MQLSCTLGGACNLVNGKEFPTNSVIMNPESTNLVEVVHGFTTEV